MSADTDYCGNGDIDSEEACDGSNLGGKTCETVGYVEGTLSCDSDCQLLTSGCMGVCGNGRLELDEVCDRGALGGETCPSAAGHPDGNLACAIDCLSLDMSGCHTCGNGVTEGPESCDDSVNDGTYGGCVPDCKSLAPYCGDGTVQNLDGESCDGTNLGEQTCQTQGYIEGTLSCDGQCHLDTSGCSGRCGNNYLDPAEDCDGTNLGGSTCETLGYPGGVLSCDGQCQHDTSGCAGVCGNGQLESGEVCEYGILGGETCQSAAGYSDGNLACAIDCSSLDTSGCYTCGNGVVEGPESCDDGNNGNATDGCYDGCSGPVVWIVILGGVFDMGSTSGTSNETPVHAVTVSTFEVTETEVTVAQYAACVNDAVCTAPSTAGVFCNWNDPGYENHPVNCVNWDQASAFCSWAGGRLPTESEWEYAARSGGPSSDYRYPWGNTMATCSYAVMGDIVPGNDGCGTDRTWSVCSKPAGNSVQGLCDMAGNVWEWVEDDWRGDYMGAPTDGTAWVYSPRGSDRVFRGGSLTGYADDLRAAFRYYFASSYQDERLGFRCAK